MAQHANLVEQKLDEHAADESTVQLTFTDEVFLRSIHWAVVDLGLPSSVYEQR